MSTAREDLFLFTGGGDEEDQPTFAAAIDRYRTEVLREAADFIYTEDTCRCGGCVPNGLAADLRRMADKAVQQQAC